MKIDVYRYSMQSVTTISAVHIDGIFECFGLEDKVRELKIKHHTAIFTGTYPVKLRKHGGHYERYQDKFPNSHKKGMLEICDVPGFTDILIHIGNKDKHTSGCLLLGNYTTNNKLQMGQLSDSTGAYLAFYIKVLDALIVNEPVNITFHNLGRMH